MNAVAAKRSQISPVEVVANAVMAPGAARPRMSLSVTEPLHEMFVAAVRATQVKSAKHVVFAVPLAAMTAMI
jgi:hypothetical protein